MLRTLILKNFILAESLELDFAKGFGVLTGETGAGKSILLDALQCVTGARADIGMIRGQSEKAEVSAIFDTIATINQEGGDTLISLFEQWDINKGDEIFLRRIIDRNGRHKAYVNGTLVTRAQLSQIGSELLEIHGQHESMQLMRPAKQLSLLDEFANLQTALANINSKWHYWQNLKTQLLNAQKNQEELLHKRENLLAQKQDLENILTVADWQAVNRRHQQLAHVQTLQEQGYIALAMLSEEEINAETLLSSATKATVSMSVVDESVKEISDLLSSAQNDTVEAARSLRHYLDKLDTDPNALAEVEGQIQMQMERARKYRVLPELLEALFDSTKQDLAAMDDGLDFDTLMANTDKAKTDYQTLAEDISITRHAAAQRLGSMVSARLPDLGMKTAHIKVQCTPTEAGANGIDAVEFQVTGLAGGGYRSMAKVVSGGELSRLALAMFLVLHGASSKTFVFDEVDAGIGGAVAEAVGRMLAELSKQHSGGQILCVTHLPQVASCALWHGLVKKIMSQDDMAKSQVTLLTTIDERIEEISRMMGGLTMTQATRDHAREMLMSGIK